MYGTIAHFRIKSGTQKEFVKTMDGLGDAVIAGWVADYYFQADADPEEFYLVAIFQDRETYQANAGSTEQHERYMKFRSFLVADSKRHGGSILSATGPNTRG